jgi:hypothetical protein
LKKSVEGLDMFGMLVRRGDFALQNEKVVWLRFADIYEIYYLDALNTVRIPCFTFQGMDMAGGQFAGKFGMI